MHVSDLTFNEAERIGTLRRLQLLDTPPSQDFDQITEFAAQHLAMPICVISLIDNDRVWFKSRYGINLSQTTCQDSFCYQVLYHQQALEVQDALEQPQLSNHPLVAGSPHVRYYFGVPLHAPNGMIVGSLCLMDVAPKALSTKDKHVVHMLAKQAETLINQHAQAQSFDQSYQELIETSSDLKKQLARQESIVNNAAAGVVRINNRGTIQNINPMVEQLLGYHSEEIIGKNIATLMPSSIAKHHDGYLENYRWDRRQAGLNQSSVIGLGREVAALHKNGDLIPIHLAVSEVTIDGESLNEFVGIMTDLRQAKAVEHKLERQKMLLNTLHTGLTDYNQLIAGDSIWAFLQESLRALTDSEYALIGEVMTGAHGPELVVHSLTDISWDQGSQHLLAQFLAGSSRITNTQSLLGRVFANGEMVMTDSPETAPGHHGLPPGHPPLQNLLALPIKHEGNVLGMIAISNTTSVLNDELVEWLEPFISTCALLIQLYRQMRERDQFTSTIEKARDELQAANQAKSEFLSSMSHELRTPLNSIIGFSQLLQTNKKTPLTEKQNKQIHQIYSSGQHLLTLINDILDLSKIEAGKLSISIEPTRISSVAKESFETLLPLAERSGIRLLVNYHEDDILALSDYTRLKQVMINLLSNAIKYNRPNGSVTVSWQVVDNFIELSVTDTGIGIAEDQRELIFEPFNRSVAEHSAIEGTGVGLALTRKIVEYMNGTISVTSDTQGSCFTVTLPLAAINKTISVEAYPSDYGVVTSPQVNTTELNKTVLYVEDNPANQRLMHDIFEDIDHLNLLLAHEPYLGLDMAKSHIPDLIILDIHMPGMTGIELLKLIKAEPSLAATPCIALSANAMPSDLKTGLQEGFEHYLTKPIDIPKFLNILDDYFEEEA